MNAQHTQTNQKDYVFCYKNRFKDFWYKDIIHKSDSDFVCRIILIPMLAKSSKRNKKKFISKNVPHVNDQVVF